MESLWNKIIREAKTVSLTKEEHVLMLENIRKQVYHKASPFNTKKQVKSPYLYHFRISLSLHEKRFVPVAVFVILVIFGSTSFAANFALPGEALYGIKVNVNEEMESWMALTPNANARFESVKADRRLKEVEKLTIQKKKITPKAKAQIKENFAKNAEKVKQIVAEIEASGGVDEAAEVKAEFENKLEAHSVVLSKLASDDDTIAEIDDEGKTDIKEIGVMVDEHINVLKTEESAKENKAEMDGKAESKDGVKKDASADESESKATETEDGPGEKETPSKESATLINTTDLNLEKKKENQTLAESKTETSMEAKKEDSKKSKIQSTKESDKKAEEKVKEEKVKVEVENILKELEISVED